MKYISENPQVILKRTGKDTFNLMMKGVPHDPINPITVKVGDTITIALPPCITDKPME